MKRFFLFILPLVFFACSSDDKTIDEIIAENEVAIQNYLSANNLTAESTPSGLHYIVEVEGNGLRPNINSTVTINYKGYDLNGDVFEESDLSDPPAFPLRGLILGWQEGLPKLSVGGSGVLIIPAQLAYGNSRPSYGQPIIFEIDLLAVN